MIRTIQERIVQAIAMGGEWCRSDLHRYNSAIQVLRQADPELTHLLAVQKLHALLEIDNISAFPRASLEAIAAWRTYHGYP